MGNDMDTLQWAAVSADAADTLVEAPGAVVGC